MANIIKINANKMKNSPIASIIGAGAAVVIAKKYGKLNNIYVLAGVGLVGAVLGANLCFLYKAKSGQPTANDVK